MKQSNGIVPESMAEEIEPIHENTTLTNESVNSLAANGCIELPEAFSLAPLKPKNVPKFKLQALYKSRLKCCIMLHFLLFLVMLARLSEFMLDKLDIFVLEIEELFIPQPKNFEFIYAFSIIFAFLGLRALSNNIGGLKSYAAGTLLFSICPLIYAAIYYFNDILEYADKKGDAEIEKWMGFPIACYQYVFLFIAIQVHAYSLFFCVKLLKIFKMKKML